MVAPLDLPLDVWDRLPPEVQAYIHVLRAQVQDLQQRVADLEARLNQNSTNSHQPPSTDGPAVKRAPPTPPTGKSRGGQPGHDRHLRAQLPPTVTVPCKPTACRACGHPLAGDDPHPLRRQVVEVPPLQPHVTEYQQHRLTCPHCGTATCGTPPADAPTGGQGPRLQALVAVLTGGYRLSKQQVQDLLADVFGVPLCAAQVCGVEAAVTDLLQPVLADLHTRLRAQPANVDETSWREGVARHWVWVAVTAYVTVYRVAATRSAAEIHQLLGATYTQVVTSDRYSSYNFLPLGQRQLCWAHLRRDFQALIDRGGAGQGVGARLLAWSDALFQAWHNVRDGTWDQARYTARMAEVRDGIHRALGDGGQSGCARTATLCQELLKREAALWTFQAVVGVEPTNNAAERALRHAVIWRKLSRGTASAGGSQFVATILSVVATCRQQGKNVLAFVTACCQAAVAKLPLPTLAPQPAA